GRAVWDSAYGQPAVLMDEKRICSLARDGVRFGSHLATHCAVDALSSAELLSELERSRAKLEVLTGGPVNGFAAPFGVSDERLFFLAKQCGYDFGLTTRPGFAYLGDDPFRLPRIEVRGDWSLGQFSEAVRGRPNPSGDLVSVVIPAYNAHDTVDETLRS